MSIYNPAAPAVYGHKFNRIKPEQVLHVPEGNTAPNTTDTSPQLRVIHGQLSLYLEGEWINIGGAETPNVRNGVQIDGEGYITWGGDVNADVTLKLAQDKQFKMYMNDGTINGTSITMALSYAQLQGSGNAGSINYDSTVNATMYQGYIRTTVTNTSNVVQAISNIFSSGYTAYMDVATSVLSTVPKMRFEVGGNYFTFKRMRVSDDSEQPMEMYFKNLVTGTATKILHYNPTTGQVTAGDPPTGGGVMTASNGLTLSGTDVKWGGTLTGNTTINAGNFTTTINSTTTASSVMTITGSQASSNVLYLSTTNGLNTYVLGVNANFGGGISISATNATRYALDASNLSGVAIYARTQTSGAGSARNVLELVNQASGSVSTAVAPGLAFKMNVTSGEIVENGKIYVQYVSNVTLAARDSKMVFSIYNAGAEITAMTLLNTGKLQLHKYGINTFAGTAAFGLGVDASGNVVETAAGGATATASNGLTKVVNDIQLGGTLTAATVINQSSTFGLKLLSSAMTANALHLESSIPSGLQVLYVKNSSATGGYGMRVDMAGSSGGAAIIVSYPSTTGTNIGISATATAIAVQAVCSAGSASNNSAVSANNQSTVQGFGVYAIGGMIASKGLISGANSGTTRIAGSFETQSSTESNTIHTALEIVHSTSGTQSLAGFGVGMNFAYMYPGTNTNKNNARIQSKFETVNGINSGTTLDFLVNLDGTNALATTLTLLSNGQAKLNKYGINTFAGTPAYSLGVDALGNLVEYVYAAGGGGGQTEVFNWKYQTNTSPADPGNGFFRGNNATASSVTNLYIDELTTEIIYDISALFGKMKGDWLIHIQQFNDANRFIQFNLNGDPIDNGGYWTLPVSFIQASGSPLLNLERCSFVFVNQNVAPTITGNIYTQDGTITSPTRSVNLDGKALVFDWLGDGVSTMSLNTAGPNPTMQILLVNGTNNSGFVMYPDGYQITTTNGTNTSAIILAPTGTTINCGNGTDVATIYLAGNGDMILNAPNVNLSVPGLFELNAGTIWMAGATGPGYVLTDVAGDGILSLQAPTGGGGGVSTGNRAYYVSPSGDDANDGLSPLTAWKTIAKVNSFTFAGGDTILFEGGKVFNDAILHCKSGTAGNRITYGSYGGSRATIQSNNAYCITIDDVSYVVVRDLIVQGTNQVEEYWGPDGVSIGVGYGSSTTIACTDINLINLKINGYAGGSGIGIWSYAATSTISNILIEGCEISGCCNGIWATLAETGNTNTYTGITVRNCKAYNNFGVYNYSDNWSGSGIVLAGCNNSLIEECEAYGNGWSNGSGFGGPHGIWMAECSNCVIRNCESHHNGTGTVGARRLDGGGFDIDGGCQNCVVEYCYSHDNAGCGYALFEYGSPRAAFTGNVIRYCISVADCRLSAMGGISIWTVEAGFTNNRIHNNLVIIDSNKIVAGTVSAVKFMGGTYNTLNIVNNIFIVDGSGITLTIGTVGGTWANNITYATNGATLNYATGCTVANPLLVNHAMEPPTVGAYAQKGVRGSAWNYQLSANSPAINSGTSTISGYTFPTKDFWGLEATGTSAGTRNIGPHELLIPS